MKDSNDDHDDDDGVDEGVAVRLGFLSVTWIGVGECEHSDETEQHCEKERWDCN